MRASDFNSLLFYNIIKKFFRRTVQRFVEFFHALEFDLAHSDTSFLKTRALARPVKEIISHSTFGCFFDAIMATPLSARTATGRAGF